MADTVATCSALVALGAVAGLRAVPGLVDVGFLGRMPFELPIRVALHLPLVATVLALALVALLAAGSARGWWGRRVRARDAALAAAVTALAVQLAAWDLVGLGL